MKNVLNTTSTIRLTSSRLAAFRLLAEVRSYTLYERGGIWCVNFRHNEKQYRLSTGRADVDSARAFVHSFVSLHPSMLEFSDKHATRMLERCRYRAAKKKVEFSLRIDDVRAILARSAGRCEVTGVALRATGPFKPSIDRIDPKRGYVQDNVRITCLIANTAMLHYGEEALLEMAQAMCSKHGYQPKEHQAA